MKLEQTPRPRVGSLRRRESLLLLASAATIFLLIGLALVTSLRP